MSKPYAQQLREWKAEQKSLKDVYGTGSGTVHKHQLRVADYALNLLKLENEAMTGKLKADKKGRVA